MDNRNIKLQYNVLMSTKSFKRGLHKDKIDYREFDLHNVEF